MSDKLLFVFCSDPDDVARVLSFLVRFFFLIIFFESKLMMFLIIRGSDEQKFQILIWSTM